MAELLFIAPVDKKDPRHPTWRGINRVSLTRPAVAAEVDPIKHDVPPQVERKTRESLSVGTIVIILDGEHKGKRAVVIADKGAGVVKVCGVVVPAIEVDQDYLIATSTKVDGVNEGSDEGAIRAAAEKTPELVDYLSSTFCLSHHDRPHLMRF